MNRATLALLLLLTAAVASADEVYLKNGGKVTGKVTEEGDKITVQRGPNQKVTLTRDQIEKIVYIKEEPAPTPPAAAPPADVKPAVEPKAVKEVELKLVNKDGGGRRFAPFPGGRYLLHTTEKGWQRLVRLSDWRHTEFYASSILPMADGQKVLVSNPFSEAGVFVCGPEEDPRKGKLVAELAHCTPAHLTPGGQWYVGFHGELGVSVWAASALDKRPTEIKRPDFRPYPKMAVRGAYCPDAKTVVVWTSDGVLQAYLLPEAKAGPTARVVPTDHERFRKDLRGERAQWPSDGKTVVVATTEEIATFDGRTLQPKVRQPIASPPNSPWRLSGSGKYLASVIAAEPGGAARVRLSSVSDLKTVAEWKRPFGAPIFNDFAFSADDRYLAVVADTDAAVLTLPKLEFIAYAKLTHTTAPWVSFLDGKTVIVSTDGETYLLPFAP